MWQQTVTPSNDVLKLSGDGVGGNIAARPATAAQDALQAASHDESDVPARDEPAIGSGDGG